MIFKRSMAVAAIFSSLATPALAKSAERLSGDDLMPSLSAEEMADGAYVRFERSKGYTAVYSDTVRACLDNGKQLVAFLKTEIAVAPDFNKHPGSAFRIGAQDYSKDRWNIRFKAMEAARDPLFLFYTQEDIKAGRREATFSAVLTHYAFHASAYGPPVRVTLAAPITHMDAPADCHAPQKIALPAKREPIVSSQQSAFVP